MWHVVPDHLRRLLAHDGIVSTVDPLQDYKKEIVDE